MNVNLNLNISQAPNAVRTFRDLSFRDSRNIVAFSKQVLANIGNNVTINNEKAVSKMLNRIDNSITNRSFGRKILDIITFQFIKIIILKRDLPHLIRNINTIAAQKLANNGAQAPDEDNDDPYDPTGLDEDSDYDSIVKNSSWKDNTEFKLNLMCRAWEHFLTLKPTLGNDATAKKTAKAVKHFFQDRIARLSRGENMAIPIYYHASRAGTDLIAGSALLKQSADGAQGAGVYFSNCDESHNGYGSCTFAMDPAQVEPCRTTYQLGYMSVAPGNWEETALWMCAKQDIQLDQRRLAYVIIPDDGDQTLTDKINKFWRDGNFFVELMPRPAADLIRRCLKNVHVHSVPKHWTTNGYGSRQPTGLRCIVAN